MAEAGGLGRAEGGPGVRQKKGAIERLYAAPPGGAAVVCLDETGPEGAESFPGAEVIDPAPEADRPAARAKQAADYGRRGKGYIFGAFRPATGEALTHPYPRRTTANWVDFLGRVEAWVPADVGTVCDAYWTAAPEIPVGNRMICFNRVIDRCRDRFGGSFHHSQLGKLCRAGLLTELHAVRGGSRRYYRLTDPAAVRELVAEFDRA